MPIDNADRSSKNIDSAFAHLANVVDQRRDEFKAGQADPKTSYTALLFSKGDDGILKKIGEEATEAVMAAKDARNANLAPEQQQLLVGEMADLWFHGSCRALHAILA